MKCGPSEVNKSCATLLGGRVAGIVMLAAAVCCLAFAATPLRAPKAQQAAPANLCWVCDILRQPCAPGIIVYQCTPASPENGSIVCCGRIGCNISIIAVCNYSQDYAYCEFYNECTGFDTYNTYNCTQCRQGS